MQVHRCRFVPHQPRPIQHIAVTPAFYPNPVVAVVRANDAIEIWNTTTRLPSPSWTMSVSQEHTQQHQQSASLPPQILNGDCARTEWDVQRNDPPLWHCIGRILPEVPPTDASGPHLEAVAWSVALEHHHHHPSRSTAAAQSAATDSDVSDDDKEDSEEERANNFRKAPVTSMSPRLFSASLDGVITEYDIETMSAVARVDSVGGGAVWCLHVTACQRYLLAGCEDGCVRVYDITGPAGHIEYLRGFQRQMGRIVCVTTIIAEDSTSRGGGGGGTFSVLTGSSDGLVLKWDFQTGQSVARMSVGRSRRPQEDVLVWDLAVLGNSNTFASADSLGCVKIWDASTCTLLQSFRAHEADVLALAASSDGLQLYAAGMDGKTVLFQNGTPTADAYREPATSGGDEKKWMVAHERRFHTHDIRSLCLLEWLHCDPPQPASAGQKRGRSTTDGKKTAGPRRVIMDHLITGGVDTQLTVLPHPSDRFVRANMQPIRLSPFPKHPIAHLASTKRLLLTHEEDMLALWKIGRGMVDEEALKEERAQLNQVAEPVAESLPIDKGPEFLLQIRVRDGMQIVSSAMSSDGTWIAACDNHSVHLYRLEMNEDGEITEMVNESHRVPSVPSCRRLIFTAKNTLSLVGLHGVVYLLQLSDKKQFAWTRLCHDGVETSAAASIPVHIATDNQGKYLVVTDSLQRTDLYDVLCRKWICKVPAFTSGGIIATLGVGSLRVNMSGGTSDHDVVMMAVRLPITSARRSQPCSQLRVFSIKKKKFLVDVERGLNCLPWLATRKDHILGLHITKEQSKPNGSKNEVIYLWTNHWLARIDLVKLLRGAVKFRRWFPKCPIDERAVPQPQRDLFASAVQGMEEGLAVTHRFQNILFFDFLAPMEACVVERPWNDILETLPAPVDVKTFGR